MDDVMSLKKQKYISHRYRIRSSTDQITTTIQRFEKLFEKIKGCTSRSKDELSIALCEALSNAIIHGNKAQPDKFVDLKVRIYKNKIMFKIKDEGHGFNYKKIPNPLDSENILKKSGRGIYLMSVLMDKVKFFKHGAGMEVVLIKYF